MIVIKLGWLILELLMTGLFLYTGSSGVLAFAAMLILAPACGFFVNFYARGKLLLTVSAAGSVRKGDAGSVTVFLDNRTVFPLLFVRCRVEIENQLNRNSAQQTVTTWLLPKKQRSISLHIEDDYCGRLRVSVRHPVLYDCFGLIGVPCKCEAVSHMTVQPDTFAPEIVLEPSFQSFPDNEIYAQERPGSDMSETFQLREYVPGDSPRQIHWKLTGKFDRLIVRDPSLPIIHSVLLFWERTGESGDPDCTDAQAEAVISICRGLLEQSVQFTVGWNDTDTERCIFHEIHNMEGLIGIIPRILRAAGKTDGISGAELLLRTAPQALCAHMIYVAEKPQKGLQDMRHFGNLTVLLCGKDAAEDAVMFDSTNYREKLAYIQI